MWDVIIINMDQSVFQFEDKSGSNLILTKCTCNKVAAKSMNAFISVCSTVLSVIVDFEVFITFFVFK